MDSIGIGFSLSEIEYNRLAHNETVIEKGLNTFVDVGNALAEIRDGKLYRQTYGTFEDYCRDRWGMVASRARQLMAAAEIVAGIESVTNVTLLPATESQARPLARLAPDEQIAAWQEAVETAPNGKVTAAHVVGVVERRAGATPFNNHAISDTPGYDGDEWYTPAEYIEAARQVMGGIDLDPASCDSAQEIVKAGEFYTKEDSGLARMWHGRVWLNPPYSMPLIKEFVFTAIDEFESGRVSEAIVLTNNSSDTAWFHALLAMYPACFTRGRVQFWRPDQDSFATRQGQVFFYLGDKPELFAEVFGQFGLVVRRWANDDKQP